MLQIFYQAIPKLYLEESLTCIIHSLIHLAECVRQYQSLLATLECGGSFQGDGVCGRIKHKAFHGPLMIILETALLQMYFLLFSGTN